jgi:single stranded DNA-binding protein
MLSGDSNLLSVAGPTSRRCIVRGFNQALLLGRLTAPPEQLQTKNGRLFLKATIAVTVAQKTGEGVSEERTSFIPATIFGRHAEVFLKYDRKGDMVHLASRLDSNEWKIDSSEKRLLLFFTVERLSLLPNKRAKAQAKPQARPIETSTRRG